MQPIRTNNDLEGWHRQLNSHAYTDQLNLYLLIKLLNDEAKLTNLQATLLSLKKLKRQQRKKQRDMEGRIFREWEEFNNGNKTAYDLMRAVGRLYSPPEQHGDTDK